MFLTEPELYNWMLLLFSTTLNTDLVSWGMASKNEYSYNSLDLLGCVCSWKIVTVPFVFLEVCRKKFGSQDLGHRTHRYKIMSIFERSPKKKHSEDKVEKRLSKLRIPSPSLITGGLSPKPGSHHFCENRCAQSFRWCCHTTKFWFSDYWRHCFRFRIFDGSEYRIQNKFFWDLNTTWYCNDFSSFLKNVCKKKVF